jgi:hypothetical protein
MKCYLLLDMIQYVSYDINQVHNVSDCIHELRRDNE